MWWEEKWIQISEVHPWTKFGRPGGVGVAVGPRPANGLGLCPPISGLGIGLSSFSVTSDPHWCSLTTTRRGLHAAPTHRPQHDSAYLSFQLSPRGWLSAFSTSLRRGRMPCPLPFSSSSSSSSSLSSSFASSTTFSQLQQSEWRPKHWQCY